MKSRELARSLFQKTAGGGGGAAVDSEELNEQDNGKKLSWGRTPFPEFQCGAGTPWLLADLSLLSH